MRFGFTLILLWICGLSHAANLLENSSFEAGDLKGWNFGGATYQVQVPFAPTNNVSWHGSNSVRFEHSITNGPNHIASRIYRLKTDTLYTLSLYAKADVGNTVANALHGHLVNADIVTSGEDINSHSTNWSLTTSWARYSGTFRTDTNADSCCYYVWIFDHWNFNGGATNEFESVDAIQLEESGSASAYSPISDVEVGANLLRSTPGHVFYSNETVSLDFVGFNNTAGSVSPTVNYDVRDLWNARLINSSFSFAISANSSITNSLTLSGLPLGWFRLTYWRNTVEGSMHDIEFSRVAPPVSLTHRTNSFFGNHLPNSAWFLSAAKRTGIHWNRLMSVENQGRWPQIEPTLGGGINVYTQSVALNRVYDIEPMMMIGSAVGRGSPYQNPDAFGQAVPEIPDWATNSVDFWPDTNYWFRFVTNMVTRYKPHVKYWELWNEQCNTNQFTNVLIYAYAGAKIADAACIIVAPAEYYALTVNRMLSKISGGTNMLDVWSCHLYDYSDASNVYEYTNTVVNGFDYTHRQVFQTESGLRTESATRGNFWNELFTATSLRPDSTGNQRDGRFRTDIITHMLYGGLRDPIKVWFYYEGRATGGYDANVAFSIFDHDQTIRPHGIMFAAAAQMIENSIPRGRLALDNTKIDSFWFDKSGQAVICMWPTNIDDTPTPLGADGSGVAGNPKKLKLTSSLGTSFFSVHDIFGNPITYGAGVRFGGLDPIYVQGIGTTTNALISSLTIALDSDTEPPKVQIITYPMTNTTGPFTFRWNAVDDMSLDVRWNGLKTNSNPLNTNAIQYAFRLDGVDAGYSAWTNVSWAPYLDVTGGSKFSVKAKDAAGNEVETFIPESIANTPRLGRLNLRGF